MKIIKNEKSCIKFFLKQRQVAFGDERIHTISHLWRDNLPRL